MLLGATRGQGPEASRLLSSDLAKAPWTEALALDFRQPAAALRDLAPGLLRSVRVYVHEVPACAGVEVLMRFMPAASTGGGEAAYSGRGFGWPLAIQLHAEHALRLHRAILASEAVVSDPANATLFYIPAFLGFLVERWIDTQDPGHLNCISTAWHEIPDDIFLRNAGYDHFLIAGTCHPYSICSAMECDITTYHPFAGNVAVLAGGTRDVGHPDLSFTPVALFRQLRTVSVPFPVTLDCARLSGLSEPSVRRPLAVAFVGSENSRVRRVFRELVEDEGWPHRSDSRVHIRVLPDSEDGEVARRAALGGDGGQRTAHVQELYAESEFCLVLPGHVYDLGRRAYDAMARGCLPVVVALAPMYVSVPFAWQLPWQDFAVFASVGSLEDAAAVVESLLAATETAAGRAAIASRRAALLRQAPALFLPPHVRCPAGAASATQSILRELAVRQAALASLRVLRPPSWPRRGAAAL
mmetsp:Transcript_81357/g.252879  ORF Transcript_81357/g.252879 Transcript_81357/m.252879 type:complete len:470 (-) Transcript_81357:45-1454(-)